ncbi:iron-containing alcohol dehydrogenase [Terasakiella pusilla]|uniref:iron-containing alcohol dehydrogenase n=1 Tax=Terasakiella pusilla TaxID=64973 RepID=UPI003AA81CEE
MNRNDFFAKLSAYPEHLKLVKSVGAPGLRAPSKFLVGLGAAQQIGSVAKGLTSGRKALLVSDGVLEKLGLVSLIASFMEDEGLEVVTFTDVEAEPHIETLEKLHANVKDSAIDVIVGLGGGSAMDMAKLVSQCLGKGQDPRPYIDTFDANEDHGLPLILLPTTSGTGSEVSVFAIVSAGDTKKYLSSDIFIPHAAILDPILTATMPKSVTAITGMDALTHAIEAIMHRNASPIVEAFGYGAVELISRSLRGAVNEPDNLEMRYDMLVGAAMAMMAFNLSGGLYAHSVSYVLTSYKGTPHGLGCALGLPYLMDFNLPVVENRLARLARLMCGDATSADQSTAAKQCVAAVVALMADIGLPTTLRDYDVPEEVVVELAKEMHSKYPRPGNPRDMSEDDSIGYWSAMYNGSL